MAIDKTSWGQLPKALREEIERRTGPIRRITAITRGENSEISLVLYHSNSDASFIKGLPLDHSKRQAQDRERAINPYISHLSARLRWSLNLEGWDLSAFQYLPSRIVNYAPGSPDLPLVAELLRESTTISCPDASMKRAEDRWSSYTDQADLFTGDYLAHTDLSPGNVLITHRAFLVDWAWPTRAAAWIDPACWAVWLIASGHPPGEAEEWAKQIPSWHTATRSALDEFARVQQALWSEIAQSNLTLWTRKLAIAAHAWSSYRGIGF